MSVLDWVFTGASSGWGALRFEIAMDEPADPSSLPSQRPGAVASMISSLGAEQADAARIGDCKRAERLGARIDALVRTQNHSGGVP